jgi:hypothetical protein
MKIWSGGSWAVSTSDPWLEVCLRSHLDPDGKLLWRKRVGDPSVCATGIGFLLNVQHDRF